MNILLLQWGLFSFLLGLMLSLPLAAVHYLKTPLVTKIFTNPRKLKSAHLDYLMQAFAIGFVYLLEYAQKTEFPLYIVIPLIFGTMCNPFILLLESTPMYKLGFVKIVYTFLQGASPLSLLFAWFTIGFRFLPAFLQLLFCVVIIIGFSVFLIYQSRLKKKNQQSQSM